MRLPYEEELKKKKKMFLHKRKMNAPHRKSSEMRKTARSFVNTLPT
jgi:hypothetical protein